MIFNDFPESVTFNWKEFSITTSDSMALLNVFYQEKSKFRRSGLFRRNDIFAKVMKNGCQNLPRIRDLKYPNHVEQSGYPPLDWCVKSVCNPYNLRKNSFKKPLLDSILQNSKQIFHTNLQLLYTKRLIQCVHFYEKLKKYNL